MTSVFLPVEIIKKTRNKQPLTEAEINFFIQEYTKGVIPDYQMSAWLMAVVWQGLTSKETLALTKAMLHSGMTVDLKSLPQPKVDKHSTGGIGDKTSLILGPIAAACGIAVPMMSGRGLGHTGGTLDKLESIPGFNTQLDLTRFTEILHTHGLCFIGQTKDICPADKKIYALRDVTGTVESLELISASIMSKKLAEDLDALVLDVKFGTGAFMKSIESAKQLARSLQQIGMGAGKQVTALITNMNQPLGAYIGNALETFEAIEILSNRQLKNKLGRDLYADTRELSLTLAAHMILLGKKTTTLDNALVLATEALESGAALNVFTAVSLAQGGRLDSLGSAPHFIELKSQSRGFIAGFQGETIGILGIKLGAGRAKVTDTIDPFAGFKLHVKIGDFVTEGDPLWTIYGSSMEKMLAVQEELLATIEFSHEPPKPFNLVEDIFY